MVSLHEGPEQRVPHHRSFVEAAAAARVGHVVYLSFVAAGPDATFLHARSHGATEELLRSSGVAYTAIRNSMYADDIPGWFDAHGTNTVPGGDGRMSFSYRPELARAIAVILTEPRHDGGIYDVVTPEAVSMAELADIATELTGETYRYRPATDADWEARWRARGKAEWEIEAGLTSYAALRQGELAVVTDDYRALTGEDPRSVADITALLADSLPLRG
jgi:NAD(P)H dehydrogenase (quinone)